MKKRRKRKQLRGCLTVFAMAAVLAAAVLCLRVPVENLWMHLRSAGISYPDIQIGEEELEDHFYYSQLNEEEQLVYREIMQGLKNCQQVICLHTEDSTLAGKIYPYVLKDCPEFFWYSGNGTAFCYEETWKREGYVELEVEHLFDEEERIKRQAEIETAVQTFLDSIPEGESEYGKIRRVYEYLITTVDYDSEAEDSQNIYSALVNHKSVCAGYAKATQYLLQKMGIYCIYVSGISVDQEGNEEDHAWNLVQCDGEYYHVDTTWGDTEPLQELENEALIYDYLCCTDEELFRTHTPDGGFDYPACTSDRWNYYKINEMFYETPDGEAFLYAMKEDIRAKEPYSVFKFGSGEVYEEAKALLKDDLIREAARFLGMQYGLAEVRYYWEESPFLNKIVLYWTYS